MANKPNNPSLWSKAKSLAKQKFDVYPSAYANGWAAKWYKSKGGTWRKAEYGMEVPYMEDGGIPDNEGFRALPPSVQQKIIDNMAAGGEPQNAGFQALPEYVQAKILSNMAYGGYIPEMAYGGDEDPVPASSYNRKVPPVMRKPLPLGMNFGLDQNDLYALKYNINATGQSADGKFRLSDPRQRLSLQILEGILGHGRNIDINALKSKGRFNVGLTGATPLFGGRLALTGNFSKVTKSDEDMTQMFNEESGANFMRTPQKKSNVDINASWQGKPFGKNGPNTKIGFTIGNGMEGPGMKYGGAAQQAAIAIAMKKAGKKPKSMQKGGEPDGAMALGQIDASLEKLMKLREFIQPDSDLEPWVSSKLTLMDHYTDAVADYMTYNPEAQGEMMEEPEGLPMPEMKNGGGIPQRYKNMGFTKVGVKKESTRPGKKWMVLAKKGDQYKVVHGGYDGMKDFSQHGSEKRKENFWNRMGGKNSSKATDPFSPLYWHKKFGTWENGGEIDMQQMKGGGSTWSGNAWYQNGGEPPRMEDYPDYGSWKSAYDAYIMAGNSPEAAEAAVAPVAPAQAQASAPAPQMTMMPREQDYPDYETYAAAVDQFMMQLPVNTVPAAPQMTPAAPQVQAAPSQTAAPAPINYAGVSIVDLLTSVGKASDYNSRKQLAAQLGIDNYYGSAKQNLDMIKMITKNPAVLSDYKPAAKPGGPSKPRSSSARSGSSKSSASKQTAAAQAEPAISIFSPEYAARQKKTYLANNPDVTEAEYDAMMAPRQQATIGPATKPMAPRTKEQEKADQESFNKFWADYDAKKINEDIQRNGPLVDRTIQQQFNNAMLDFFTKEVPMTVATAGLPFIRWGTKVYPYGQKLIPEVVNAARRADRALPYATRALPGIKEMGGEYDFDEYKKGGIYINPKKKGTFKAQATKMGMGTQEAAAHILANKEDYSPAMVKKANFARNFAKQEGGPVVGAEIDVTPEQLEMLKAQGYQFEII